MYMYTYIYIYTYVYIYNIHIYIYVHIYIAEDHGVAHHEKVAGRGAHGALALGHLRGARLLCVGQASGYTSRGVK